MANKQEVIVEFTKCPLCKLREELAEILGKPELALGDGTRRFAESVAAEQMEKGLFRTNLQFGLHQMGGPVVDPAMANRMLFGATIPFITALLDVCLDCGCIYAVQLQRGETTSKAAIVKRPPGHKGN